MFEFSLVLVISFVVSTIGAPLTTPQPFEPAPTLVVNASHAPVDWTKHGVWKFQSSNGKPAIIPGLNPTVANLGEEILEFVKEEDDLEQKLRESAGTLKQHSLALEEAPADTLLLVPQYRAVASEPETNFVIDVTTELPTTLDYNTRGPYRYEDEGRAFPAPTPSSTFVPVVALNEAKPRRVSTTPQIEYVSVIVETTPSFKRRKTVPETTTFVPAVALLEKERISANLPSDVLPFAPVPHIEPTTPQVTSNFVPVIALKEIEPAIPKREDSLYSQSAPIDHEFRSDSDVSFNSK
jgi:hypothetical protein